MTLDTLQAVTAELNRRGIPASLQYPGSIHANVSPEITLIGGDANETFDIDVCEGEEEQNVIETIGSSLPSDSTDVQTIADHFACTYNEAKEAGAGSGGGYLPELSSTDEP